MIASIVKSTGRLPALINSGMIAFNSSKSFKASVLVVMRMSWSVTVKCSGNAVKIF
ncbi:MAG: hypothetical protein LUC37_03070 [Prevotella sp.]|nr:hypothetical protein [Prevotella sp.]